MPTRLKPRRICRTLGLAIFFLCHIPAHAQSVADQALVKARAGEHEEAILLYRQALAAEPNDVAILRDYAVVLGWAGKYSEAIPVVKKVRSMDNNQPEWALREFAAIYLFGDATEDALRTLSELTERGDNSEQTLNRRALALRWLGRPDEAQTVYRALLQSYPDSKDGVVGLAYALSDEKKFSEALQHLNSPDPQVVKAKIRILNWSGRHYQAQRLLDTLPGSLKDDREVLEDRIAAARWGGDPSGAMKELLRLSQLFPSAETTRMSADLRTEYGYAVVPAFRYVKDNFGLVERSLGNDVTIHVTPSHALHIGYQYRWFKQDQAALRTLVRYDLGWSGDLSRRISVYATAASVDYRQPGLEKKIVGDGSITVNVNDKLRLSGGGGSIVMDAYPALAHQVTAPFEFGDVAFRVDSRMQLQTRFSHYAFSDEVTRDRADFRFTRSMFKQPRVTLNIGWRSSWMWHDAYTPDFWSPARFQSHVAVAQIEGRAASWLDYSGEIAGGWQSELSSQLQHPVQTAGRIAIHPDRHWRTVLEIGKSTSSLDRVFPGQRPYSRWVTSMAIEFRFP